MSLLACMSHHFLEWREPARQTIWQDASGDQFSSTLRGRDEGNICCWLRWRGEGGGCRSGTCRSWCIHLGVVCETLTVLQLWWMPQTRSLSTAWSCTIPLAPPSVYPSLYLHLSESSCFVFFLCTSLVTTSFLGLPASLGPLSLALSWRSCIQQARNFLYVGRAWTPPWSRNDVSQSWIKNLSTGKISEAAPWVKLHLHAHWKSCRMW